MIWKDIKIYKIKDWCIYFKSNNNNYMIRHMEECGDHWNLLTNKSTWKTVGSDYTLFNIRDFIKPKYGNLKRTTPYSHLDLEYFKKCLNEQFKVNSI